MGLLDKLWDDVVAGPQPDQGLSRLRRNPKLQFDGMFLLPLPFVCSIHTTFSIFTRLNCCFSCSSLSLSLFVSSLVCAAWSTLRSSSSTLLSLLRLLHVSLDLEETVDEEFIAGRRRSSEFLRHQEETRRVAQSIPILKRPPRLRIDSLDMDYTDSAPSTPGAPSTPSSSFAASPFSSMFLILFLVCNSFIAASVL